MRRIQRGNGIQDLAEERQRRSVDSIRSRRRPRKTVTTYLLCRSIQHVNMSSGQVQELGNLAANYDDNQVSIDNKGDIAASVAGWHGSAPRPPKSMDAGHYTTCRHPI